MSVPSSQPLLSVAGLVKRYPPDYTALAGVDLAAQRDRGLAGPQLASCPTETCQRTIARVTAPPAVVSVV
jgi:hypothetical protein